VDVKSERRRGRCRRRGSRGGESAAGEAGAAVANWRAMVKVPRIPHAGDHSCGFLRVIDEPQRRGMAKGRNFRGVCYVVGRPVLKRVYRSCPTR